ncbi:hypothetical protein Fmac_018617 [Flemingia macrophylla]|uniref:Uncharacterized protein n=1 Tax=Flemingia macrophylla TaxID=520843 RepID=A0ABD1M5L5_9FABA
MRVNHYYLISRSLLQLLRFSTVHLHLFSTRAVTHLIVSGYIFGALHDPSDTFSKWPYDGFSWADHGIIQSISGHPTVVTKVIPFFSPRIVISAVYPALILFPAEKKKPILYEGDVAAADLLAVAKGVVYQKVEEVEQH